MRRRPAVCDFSRALKHLEQTIRLYNPNAHASFANTQGFGHEVNAHSYAALCYDYLGHPDRALALSEDAVALAKRLEHHARKGRAAYPPYV